MWTEIAILAMIFDQDATKSVKNGFVLCPFWSFGVSFVEVLLIAGLQGVGGSNVVSTQRMRTNLDTWHTQQTAIRFYIKNVDNLAWGMRKKWAEYNVWLLKGESKQMFFLELPLLSLCHRWSGFKSCQVCTTFFSHSSSSAKTLSALIVLCQTIFNTLLLSS